jgi:hypothetical protein
MRSVALSCVASLLLAAAAAAADVPAALSSYVERPEQRDAIVAAAKALAVRLPDACPTMTYAIPGSIRFAASAEFDEHGDPVKGSWVETVAGSGCGRMIQFNVLTVVGPDRRPRSASMLPGDSRAEPGLEHETIAYALHAVRPVMSECRAIGVIDTRFDGFEDTAVAHAKDGPDARPWRETWTVAACGTLFEVPIHFIPDETGIGIKTLSSELRVKR